MPVAPFLVAGLVVAASLGRAASLALDPDPFAADAAATLAAWLIVQSIIVAGGLLIARGRWARPTALALAGLSLALGLVVPLDLGSLVALLLAGAALAAVAGPWLTRRWLRRLPSADGPPASAVVLVLGLLSLPAVVALARPGGLGPADWAVVAAGAILALGVGRARPPALWAARLALPPLAIVAAVADGFPGGAVVGTLGIAVGALAWSPRVARSVSPLAPEPVRPIPIPPELVDPGLLRAAGYDELGRPRRGAAR